MSRESRARRVTNKFVPRSQQVPVDEKAPASTDQDLWAEVRRFFEDDIETDPYSKENASSDSYVVTGQPCHGGYAAEANPGPITHEEDAE